MLFITFYENQKAAEKKVQSHLILWGIQVPHLQYSFQEPNNKKQSWIYDFIAGLPEWLAAALPPVHEKSNQGVRYLRSMSCRNSKSERPGQQVIQTVTPCYCKEKHLIY